MVLILHRHICPQQTKGRFPRQHLSRKSNQKMESIARERRVCLVCSNILFDD